MLCSYSIKVYCSAKSSIRTNVHTFSTDFFRMIMSTVQRWYKRGKTCLSLYKLQRYTTYKFSCNYITMFSTMAEIAKFCRNIMISLLENYQFLCFSFITFKLISFYCGLHNVEKIQSA